ncbi:MAG TPA: phosphoribosylformylglycinamidine cyclo-ligase [Syntrophomonadaceae bacterium]|nr:phosphoribosylformylglycinamidine cyclo-ligase [Syntrophomonadaceae bacterium]
MSNEGLDYKGAGVDIDAANRSVDMIKKWVNQTRRPEVLSGIGSFGGFFALDNSKYREPVLVSGTDGVGTKLKVAQMLGVHDTVGIDLVAMCVNDILVHGAEPLFFLDYIALGVLKPDLVEALVKGISQGCLEAGCSLIGGETAEMPGFYDEDKYDLAGFAVGVVERSQLIDGQAVEPGNIIIALPSSGLHSNGYSLARKTLLQKAGLQMEQVIPELGRSLGEELLQPTRIYVKSVQGLLQEMSVRAMAHITGGGIPENLSRVLPPGMGAAIEASAIETPPIFKLVEHWGQVARDEMFRTFNMGVGFLLVVSESDVDGALRCLAAQGEKPLVVGVIKSDIEGVVVK